MTGNGMLDTTALVGLANPAPIDPRAGTLATIEVAHQWALLVDAYRSETGLELTASEGYRTFEAQVYWKQYWTEQGKPQNASAPGYSNHGLAIAIDAGGGAGTPGSAADTWLDEHGPDYGFHRPYTSGRVIERWHLLYVGGATITSAPITTTPVGDTMNTHIVRVDASAKRKKGSYDSYLVNPETMRCMHITSNTQEDYWRAKGVPLQAGIQAPQVLANFEVVGK